MWEKISTKLNSIISANTLLQSVYTYEASNLEGSPACTIIPSANENAYSTTIENRRVYAFVVRLYIDRLSGNTTENTTETAMRQLVDTVLDDLDKNHQLSGLETQSGYTFLFMSASPSVWGYAGRENNLRVAEIVVRCHFAIDVNVIS